MDDFDYMPSLKAEKDAKNAMVSPCYSPNNCSVTASLIGNKPPFENFLVCGR
jgi:hypothetical protein